MKTNQLILAAALMALVSCTKENVDFNANALDNEIGFTAVTKKATKANDAIIDGATYATENTFKVWGWQSQAGTFAEFSEGAASNFMSNLTISYCGGPQDRADAWRNADNYYYWPFTGKISFLAIHPSTIVPSLLAGENPALTTGWDATNKLAKATIANYTISASNKTTDLMFAEKTGSRNASDLDASGNLGLVFKHALSQIVVKAKTNDDYSADVQFDLESVQFNNIDLSGDLAYANEDFTWTDNEAHSENWMYYNTVKTDIKNTYANADDYIYGAAILMVPQPAYKHVDADPANSVAEVEGTTITIGYSMQQLPKANNAKISGTITVPAPWTKVKEGDTTHNPAAAFNSWEAGKKYVYTLNFKLNEILFNPTVTDWVEVEVSAINILD